jgi:hypothetical protein
MPSVSYRPHPSAHVVVARSRPAAALALVLGLGAWPLEARAAAPDAAVAPVSQHAVSQHAVSQHEWPAEPREESYRDLLTLSYVLAPFLALGVGHTLAELEAEDSVAVLAGTTMFLTPAAVHMAHGNVGHGPLAFLGMGGSTVAGMFLGGVVGYNIGSIGCDSDEDSSCDFAGLDGLVFGALIGGVTGYTGFAIYDVLDNGAVAIDAVATHKGPPADRASLHLWLSPLPAAKVERAEPTSPFGGVFVGATLQM